MPYPPLIPPGHNGQWHTVELPSFRVVTWFPSEKVTFPKPENGAALFSHAVGGDQWDPGSHSPGTEFRRPVAMQGGC